jgi:hypothetical protein
MRIDFAALSTEIGTDPLGRGYSGMTDKQVADDLNTEYRTMPIETVRSADIFEAMDRTEFAALADAEKARIDRILALGDGIRVGSSQARDELLDIFGAGTTTRANLTALQTQSISRARELGLVWVTEGDVATARSV